MKKGRLGSKRYSRTNTQTAPSTPVKVKVVPLTLAAAPAISSGERLAQAGGQATLVEITGPAKIRRPLEVLTWPLNWLQPSKPLTLDAAHDELNRANVLRGHQSGGQTREHPRAVERTANPQGGDFAHTRALLIDRRSALPEKRVRVWPLSSKRLTRPEQLEVLALQTADVAGASFAGAGERSEAQDILAGHIRAAKLHWKAAGPWPSKLQGERPAAELGRVSTPFSVMDVRV